MQLVQETTPGDIVGALAQGAAEEALNLSESVKGNLPFDDHLQNVNRAIDTAESESQKGLVQNAVAEVLDRIGNSMRTDHENQLDAEDGEHGDALAEAAQAADDTAENHLDQEDADFFDDSTDDDSATDEDEGDGSGYDDDEDTEDDAGDQE